MVADWKATTPYVLAQLQNAVHKSLAQKYVGFWLGANFLQSLTLILAATFDFWCEFLR
jgi:hypothetical protein